MGIKTGKDFDEVKDIYGVNVGENGSMTTAKPVDSKTMDYIQKIYQTSQKADKAKSDMYLKMAGVSGGAAATSPALDQASILYEKVKKYMPVRLKQQGMENLGVSQTAMLRANRDYMETVANIKASQAPAMSAADIERNQIADEYNEKMKEIADEYAGINAGIEEDNKAELDDLPQKIADMILGGDYNEEQAASEIYGMRGLTAEQAKAAYEALENPKKYSKKAQEDILGQFKEQYGQTGGMSAEEYLKLYKQYMTDETEKGILEYESTMQADVDHQAMIALQYAGGDNASADQIQFILDNYPGMSDDLRNNLESMKIGKGIARTESALAEFEDKVNNGTYDFTTIDGKKQFVMDVDELVKKGITLDRLGTETSKKYEDFKTSVAKYDENAKLSEELVEKGEAKIDGTNFYKVQSNQDDVDAFLAERKDAANEAVRKALGTDKALYNGNVTAGTVIKVDGVKFIKVGNEEAGYWTPVSEKKKGMVFMKDEIYNISTNRKADLEKIQAQLPDHPQEGQMIKGEYIHEKNKHRGVSVNTYEDIMLIYKNGAWYICEKK